MDSKNKKIPVSIYSEQVRIFVLVRKKHKLSELYPQRAILEESRKNSSLIQANDWIDHDYYEKELELSIQRESRMMKKYGVKIPKKPLKRASEKPITVRKIKPLQEYK